MQLMAGNTSAFFFYAPEFFATHPNTHVTKEWKPDNEVVDSFRSLIIKQGLQFTADEVNRDLPRIADRLRKELLVTALSKDVSEQNARRNDPEVLKAVDSLGSSKALLDRARETLASKKATAAS